MTQHAEGQHWIGPPPAPTGTPTDPAGPPSRRKFILGLSIACGILLLVNLGFGVASLALMQAPVEPAPSPSPSATSDATTESEPETVNGVTVTSVSDYEITGYTMSAADENGLTAMYALIENDDPAQAVSVSFDMSAYDEDGLLIDRTPANEYLMPGQTAVFQAILTVDVEDVERIRIEQTRVVVEPPPFTGEIKLESIATDDKGVVEGTFTSSLSAPTEYADVYLVGRIDGEMFAICSAVVDVPAAGTTFTARCRLHPVSAEERPKKPVTKIPEDAVFAASLNPTRL